jgi:hypothetical protein
LASHNGNHADAGGADAGRVDAFEGVHGWLRCVEGWRESSTGCRWGRV